MTEDRSFNRQATGTANEQGAKELRNFIHTQHANEPTRFGIRSGEIDSFLESKGFAVIEHLSADEMAERYLSAGSYPDIGKIPSLFCFVHARVR